MNCVKTVIRRSDAYIASSAARSAHRARRHAPDTKNAGRNPMRDPGDTPGVLFWSCLASANWRRLAPDAVVARLSICSLRCPPASERCPAHHALSLLRFQVCHTPRTGPGYCATNESAVSSVIPSTVACATSMRSKRSLWICGKLSMATACSLLTGNSL